MTSEQAKAQKRVALLDDTLRRVPYQYSNKGRLRSDVAALLQTCETLTPQVAQFERVTLFFLSGTIPISYQGSKYNIPITIYFDPPYPNKGPRCFVTPTPNMAIAQGHANVDKGGMVTFPYLDRWHANTSTLTEVTRGMAQIFAERPPVHATTDSKDANPTRGRAEPRPAAATPPLASRQPPAAASGRMPVVQGTLLGPQASARREVESRVKQRWDTVLGPIVDDTNKQLQTQRQLEQAATEVDAELAALTMDAERLTREEAGLATVEVELRDFVESKSAEEDVDTSCLQEQLDPNSAIVLERLSEELALEDLLVALDDLLEEKKISTDDFMREVRDASRRQFMCRMERQKAAGLVAADAAPLLAESVPIPPERVSDATAGAAVVATAMPVAAAPAAPAAARAAAPRGRALVAG